MWFRLKFSRKISKNRHHERKEYDSGRRSARRSARRSSTSIIPGKKMWVTGIVQRRVGRNISINLGKADALLTENEQVRGEHLPSQ